VGTCSNCRQPHGRLILGRCNTCYRFHKRTGRERDVEQITRTNALRLEREMAVPYGIQARYQHVARVMNESYGDPRHLQTARK
jgi:hypothetical protein